MMRLPATVLTMFVLVGLAAPPVESQSAAGQGIWAEKARLGHERTEAAVVAVGGRIYALAGMSRGQDSDTLNQE